MTNLARIIKRELDTSKVCPVCYSGMVEFERDFNGGTTCMLTCRDCGYYGEVDNA